MSRPLISIITPSFQQADYLEECLSSVHDQDGVQVDHIVMDGGSSDGSAAIIEKHARQLMHWESEPDEGQSHAINKGLDHAAGDVFNWLNSDDAYLPGALKKVSEAFSKDPALLVFGGRVLHRNTTNEKVFEPINDASNARQLHLDPIINQPATFYRMDVVRDIGGVDTSLRYVMDVELWWQFLFKFGAHHTRFEPIELAMFRLHDASKTVSEHSGFLNEIASILHQLCLRVELEGLASVLSLGHLLKKGLRGIPAKNEHQGIVRDMAVHFLLKWHGLVHNEEQFHMMKELIRSNELNNATLLNASMSERAETMRQRLKPNSWTAYRIHRKLEQLRK